MSILTIQNLRVIKQGSPICSLDELSLQRGEHVGLLGANGSGKSTLLRVVAGFERDYQGKCHLSIAENECVYVHQSPYFFRGTVLANVSYGIKAHGQFGNAGLKRAWDWLEKFGIGHLANSPARQLSGGEKKRAAIARALAVSPKLLLLDEPFAEMDETGVSNTVKLLKEQQETTLLIATPTKLPNDLVRHEISISTACVVPVPTAAPFSFSQLKTEE